MARELREMTTLSGVVELSSDVADVADLLLELTTETAVVSRAELRDAWAAVATDLLAHQTEARTLTRGNITSHVLKNSLVWLEKLGAVQRKGPQGAGLVVVLEPDVLRDVVALWDDES